MPDGFPCPNPACTHTFPPSAVKGSAVLSCPRCGTVYKFRLPEAPKPKASPPAAKPVARQAAKPGSPPAKKPPPPPPPVAAPVAVAPPVAPPVGRAERVPDPALNLESSPEMVLAPSRKRKPRRRSGGWIKGVVAVVLIGGICSAIGYGIYWGVKNAPTREDGDDSPAGRKILGNFSLSDAPRGWRPDTDLRMALHVNYAISRKKPRNHFALAYRPYKKRAPGDSELLDEALMRLKGGKDPFFPRFEYNDPLQNKDNARGSLSGEPAIVFDFTGTDREGTPMVGQVSMPFRRGIAYWLYVWGPEDEAEQLPAGWETARAGFKLEDGREGWKPTPRETDRLTGSGYQLNYLKDLWQKEENPKAYDDQCEFALKGYEPTEDEETGKKKVITYAGKLATIQFLILDHKADDKGGKSAYEVAEAHVRKKETELYPNIKFEALNDKNGKPQVGPDVGAFRGQLAHLRIQRDPDNERYGVLAVATLAGGKILAIYADCPYYRIDFWRHEFKAVIETVRRPKG